MKSMQIGKKYLNSLENTEVWIKTFDLQEIQTAT